MLPRMAPWGQQPGSLRPHLLIPTKTPTERVPGGSRRLSPPAKAQGLEIQVCEVSLHPLQSINHPLAICFRELHSSCHNHCEIKHYKCYNMQLILLIDLLLLISVLALALPGPVIIPVDYVFKLAYLPYPSTFHISSSGAHFAFSTNPPNTLRSRRTAEE